VGRAKMGGMAFWWVFGSAFIAGGRAFGHNMRSPLLFLVVGVAFGLPMQ